MILSPCNFCRDGIEPYEAAWSQIYGEVPRFCDHCEKWQTLRTEWLEAPAQMESLKIWKRRKIDAALKKSGVSDRFQDKRLSDLKSAPKLLEICQGYVDNWEEMDQKGFGLYFWGDVGTWKTHTASAIANELIEKHLVEVMFISFSDVADRVRKSFDSDNADKSLFNDMKEVDLLVIDDFGMEKPTDWLKEQIFLVVNSRYENRKPIIITSNQSLEDIGKMMMAQIASRLIEVSRTVRFTGEDKRVKKEHWWDKM